MGTFLHNLIYNLNNGHRQHCFGDIQVSKCGIQAFVDSDLNTDMYSVSSFFDEVSSEKYTPGMAAKMIKCRLAEQAAANNVPDGATLAQCLDMIQNNIKEPSHNHTARIAAFRATCDNYQCAPSIFESYAPCVLFPISFNFPITARVNRCPKNVARKTRKCTSHPPVLLQCLVSMERYCIQMNAHFENQTSS